MNVRLHSRNTTIDDDFRRMAEEKVVHAGRVLDDGGVVDVEVGEEQNPRRTDDRFRIELTSTVAGRVVRIVTASSTPTAALDEAVDRYTYQLRRLKERTSGTHHKANHEGSVPASSEESEIVRRKQFVMKPMTVDEAALQMDLLGHDFFFFLNVATGDQSVLYRRRDGRLGLIEPA